MDLLQTLHWTLPGAVVSSQVEAAVADTPGLAELDALSKRRALILGAAILVEEMAGKEIVVSEPFNDESEAQAWLILKAAGKTVKSPSERRQRIIAAMEQAVKACAARMSLSPARHPEPENPIEEAIATSQVPLPTEPEQTRELSHQRVSPDPLAPLQSLPAPAKEPRCVEAILAAPAQPPKEKPKEEKRKRFPTCPGCTMRKTNCICPTLLTEQDGAALVREIRASISREQEEPLPNQEEHKPKAKAKSNQKKKEPSPAFVDSSSNSAWSSEEGAVGESSSTESEADLAWRGATPNTHRSGSHPTSSCNQSFG